MESAGQRRRRRLRERRSPRRRLPFGLGGLANLGQREAVLPAYLVGMALAPFFVEKRELQTRMRAICFAFLTPFYFLKAGSLIEWHALIAGAGLIAVFLAVKMLT